MSPEEVVLIIQLYQTLQILFNMNSIALSAAGKDLHWNFVLCLKYFKNPENISTEKKLNFFWCIEIQKHHIFTDQN